MSRLITKGMNSRLLVIEGFGSSIISPAALCGAYATIIACDGTQGPDQHIFRGTSCTYAVHVYRADGTHLTLDTLTVDFYAKGSPLDSDTDAVIAKHGADQSLVVYAGSNHVDIPLVPADTRLLPPDLGILLFEVRIALGSTVETLPIVLTPGSVPPGGAPGGTLSLLGTQQVAAAG